MGKGTSNENEDRGSTIEVLAEGALPQVDRVIEDHPQHAWKGELGDTPISRRGGIPGELEAPPPLVIPSWGGGGGGWGNRILALSCLMAGRTIETLVGEQNHLD